MNRLGPLWEREIYPKLKTSNAIAWIVSAIILSGCSGNHLKKDDTPIRTWHQTSGYYHYDPLETTPIEILNDESQIQKIAPGIYLNKRQKNEWIDNSLLQDLDIDLAPLNIPKEELNNTSQIETNYSWKNDKQVPITVFLVPEFESERKILRQKVSEMIDFPIISCTEWLILKGEEELEIRAPLTCKSDTSEIEENLYLPKRWYYDVNINWKIYKFPHSDCKDPSKIKWPPSHHIEIFNQADMWRELVRIDNYRVEKWYLDRCIKEKESTIRR